MIAEIYCPFVSRENLFYRSCYKHPVWNSAILIQRPQVQVRIIFLHAKPWILGAEKSIFTVVIHWWRSHRRQFARARTVDDYDVTMVIPYLHETSQIDCGDVTMLSQKKPSLATMAKSEIDNCFYRKWMCSTHKIACKNKWYLCYRE